MLETRLDKVCCCYLLANREALIAAMQTDIDLAPNLWPPQLVFCGSPRSGHTRWRPLDEKNTQIESKRRIPIRSCVCLLKNKGYNFITIPRVVHSGF